ncbi:DedA family protein [Youhaiella tibetensis]|uniref:DedA family protein n=1 Tax=Paradevosia tibetensis TaxID=1447062 RepID=A0A5B9DM72_9HYPH|nr:DedA family protein [Youhaiella tibetensis]QEE19985.1 DedA family protein [Youhaiella tibetensis]GGF28081.1 DedA family protein [Youhaiella tibetensis]
MSLLGLSFSKFVASYGYLAVAGLVGLESIGIPVPGETVLISAGVLAGATHDLQIGWVIAAAAAGAIIGDTIGYLIGRTIGFRVLKRYGVRVGLTEPRLKVARYLFTKHGGKVVFFGRFVSLLRTLTALAAGANKMPWPEFFLFNATGGIVWASVYGLGAYYAGKAIDQFSGPLGLLMLGLGIASILASAIYFSRHEQDLIAAAEAALPGPLT